LAHPSVAEAAVTAVPAPGGELTLAAYCVPVRAGEEHPRTEGEPAPREGAGDADWTGTLRAALAERLPEHLVPGHFVV
ncbi:amino acid adenylation domain-containing protein, partial [Streptomyces sp. SID10362]